MTEVQKTGLSDECGNLEDLVAKLETELNDHEARLAEIMGQCDSTEKIMSETGGSSDALVSNIKSEIEQQVAGLTDIAPLIGPVQEDITKLDEEIRALSDEIEQKKADAAAKTALQATQADQLSSMRKEDQIRKKQVEEKTEKVANLTKQLTDMDADIETTGKKVEEYLASHAGMKSADPKAAAGK